MMGQREMCLAEAWRRKYLPSCKSCDASQAIFDEVFALSGNQRADDGSMMNISLLAILCANCGRCEFLAPGMIESTAFGDKEIRQLADDLEAEMALTQKKALERNARGGFSYGGAARYSFVPAPTRPTRKGIR